MSNTQQIDWQKLRRSLPKAELAQFNYLCREIGIAKKIVAMLTAWKAVVKRSKTACDKHYIHGCYTCSPLEQIDKRLKSASSELGKLRFRLISLPTVAAALGRPAVLTPSEREAARNERENERLARQPHPVERLFGRMQRFDQTAPLEARDLTDKIYLLDSWLKGKAQERGE